MPTKSLTNPKPDAGKFQAIAKLRMIVKLRIVAVLLLALWTSYWIVQNGRASHALLLDNPDMAPGIHQSRLASLQASRQLAQGRYPEAAAAARAALQHRGGDVIAIRVLALVAERNGNMPQAEKLMAIGARWSWRDTPTQAWLLVRRLQAGQFEEGIAHGEALVARRRMVEILLPVFAALSVEPRALGPLTKALERGADWRAAFYQNLRKAPPELHMPLAALMAKMKNGSAPPARTDAAPLMEAMLDAGNPAAARALWLRLFGKPSDASLMLNDGGFDTASLPEPAGDGQTPFDWQFEPSAEIYLVRDPDHKTGRVLHLASAGRSRTPIARQRLTLEPENWLLSLRLRAISPDVESRFRIGVRCKAAGEWLTIPLGPMSSGHWQSVTLPFTVASDCPSQNLSIEPIGTMPGDEVDIWLDDIAVRSAA